MCQQAAASSQHIDFMGARDPQLKIPLSKNVVTLISVCRGRTRSLTLVENSGKAKMRFNFSSLKTQILKFLYNHT